MAPGSERHEPVRLPGPAVAQPRLRVRRAVDGAGRTRGARRRAARRRDRLRQRRGDGDRRLVVLDPLCGRGTTLNQALMYGFDAYGADIDAKDVAAYAVFIQRWLKDKRLKHQASFAPVRRDHRVVARRLTAQFAATKDEYQAGDVQRLEVIETDTARIGEFFPAACADLVVADLPYGIQHGSHAAARPGTLARSPLDLLRAAAPAWARALRPGGALGISWNTHLARRADAAGALAAAGLEVLDSAACRAFRHRVDQAITRDVLISRKPAGA